MGGTPAGWRILARFLLWVLVAVAAISLIVIGYVWLAVRGGST